MKRVILFVSATLLISTLALADIDPASLTPCKFSRAGTPCAPGTGNDCPAFLVTVTVGPHTLDMAGSGLWGNPMCPGAANADLSGTVGPLEAGTWIVPLVIPGLPAGAPYSIDWIADGNDMGCTDYVVGDPTIPVDCDATGAAGEPLLMSIFDLK
jgi:hypothetical protein